MRLAAAMAALLAVAATVHAQDPASVPGLKVWVDASRALGNTGDRIVSLSPSFGPSLAGIGPLLERRSVGLADSLRFTGAELLRSQTNLQIGRAFTAVAAFRPSAAGRRMTIFQVGLASPLGARIDTDGHLQLFASGDTAKGNQRWSAGDTGVVALVWNGRTALLYVNGTLDASLTPGAIANTTGNLTLGARNLGQDGFRGDFVGLSLYDRVLTDVQRRTVETFYAGPTATPLDATYVSTLGRIGANGLLASDPLPTLDAALAARAINGGQILVDAPLTRPLRGMTTITSEATLAIRGLNSAPWAMVSGETFKGGWSHDADGAWSHEGTSRTFLAAFIPTLLDAKGRPERLVPNYVGGALAPGTIAVENGRLRVRLPHDENPNLHTLEISRETSCLRIENGRGNLTLENGIFRGGSQACVQVSQPDRGGNLTANDCVAEYGVCGFRGEGLLSTLTLNRCVARLTSNDGFSMKAYAGEASTMWMNNCESYENVEEGASPHNGATIYAQSCWLHDNGESGMMSIATATFIASDCIFERNNQRRTAPTEGGCAYGQDSRGMLTRCTFRDNKGAGFYRTVPRLVTMVGNVSTGNADPDR